MEMQTVIPYIVFLLACFGLAWSIFLTVSKAALAITYGAAKRPFNVDWTPQLWVGSISFTVIMGYIFIF